MQSGAQAQTSFGRNAPRTLAQRSSNLMTGFQRGHQNIRSSDPTAYAAQSGQFELNVMLPGMLKCMLESTDMLKNFLPIFSANLIDGLTANKDKLREDIENSPVIVTLLTPKIGYLKSAELFKESLKTGKTIRELVVSKKLMSNREIDSLFG